MTDRFVINLEELDDIVGQMSRFDTDAEHLCDNVDRLVSQLHVTWSGEGAVAQQRAHERWQRGAEQMRSALTDLHSVARTAHGNYTAAVEANLRMWPA